MPAAVDFGGDELAGAAEHPAVRRIRHRRLIAFLWLQGLERTFDSMVRETDAAFSAAHLRDLVAQGQWRGAVGYLSRFLPPPDDDGGSGGRLLMSLEARVLHRFLAVHTDLADILAGTERGDALAASFREYRDHDRTVSRGALRIRCFVLTALTAKQHLMASLNLERVWQAAGKIVHNLVRRTPELRRAVLIPPGPLKPHNVLPIRSCTDKRCHRKKKEKIKYCRQTRAYVILNRYLRERGRLQFSSRSKESPDENEKMMNWVADIVDRSLKAGEPPKLYQEHSLQTSGKQGATSASVQQPMVGALSGAAQDPGIPSAANAGTRAGEMATNVLSPGAPFSRTIPGATVSQTNPSIKSGIS